VLRRTIPALALTATLLLGACGDDSGDDTTSTGDTSSQTTSGDDATTTTAQATGDDTGSANPCVGGDTSVTVSGDLDNKPEIDMGGQEAVDDLVCQDIIDGTGDVVQAGDTITVQYVGQLLDGTQFDASWDRGEPITFPLQGVIQGWQDGIPGMKVGGRRLLVIPGDQAYGPSGTQGIPPNATLVFVVDLVSIG
jgi:peptidylprolyl isomerase